MPTVIIPDAVVTLKAETCCVCGVAFAMPSDLMRNRREDRLSFYCPNGHAQGYTQSEADRLRDELARERHRAEQAQASVAFWQDEHARTERSLRATKAVVTRTKKKIVAGRCPCCSHQFKDLRTHMSTRHPNYDPDKAIEALEAKA